MADRIVTARVWGPRRRKAGPGRKSRPWVVTVRYADGARELKSFKATPGGKEAADDYAAAKRLEVRAAAPALEIDRNIKLADYGARWLRRSAPKWKRGTVLQYETTTRVHIFPALGAMRVRDVHQQHIANFLTDLIVNGMAKSTAHTVFAILRKMLKKAKFEGVITNDPTAGIWAEVPASEETVSSRTKAMGREQLGRFLDSVTSSDLGEALSMFYLTASGTGMRVGELVALTVADVQLERASIRVHKNLTPERYGSIEDRLDSTKTAKEREVELGATLVGVLRGYVKGADPHRWLFPDPAGAPLSRNVIRYSFDKLRDAAGLPGHLTPHSLRHTYASLSLAGGASVVWVANQLGHSTPTMTLDVYAWAIPSGDRRWAGLLDDTMSPENRRPLATIIGVNASVLRPDSTVPQEALNSVGPQASTLDVPPRSESSDLEPPVSSAEPSNSAGIPPGGDRWRPKKERA